MKKYRTVLVYVLLLSIVVLGIAMSLPHLLPGPTEVGIRGKVTRDGKPLEWTGDEPELKVLFVPVDREKDQHIYPADCDTKQGTFSIAKLPTGPYIVALQQNADRKTDLLGFRYDPEHSDLQRDVTHDGQEFHIDLPRNLPTNPPRPGMPAGRRTPPDAAKKTEPK